MVMVVVLQLHVLMYNHLHLALLLRVEMIFFVLGLLNAEMFKLHAVVSLQVVRVSVLHQNQLQDLVFVFGRTVLAQRLNAKIYP